MADNLRGNKMEAQLRIGTRGSKLALAQTNIIQNTIQNKMPQVETETVILETKGDRIRDRALSEIGGKGVFIEEIERALRDGRIDLAVHSGKDIPTILSEEFSLWVITPRENPLDVLVCSDPGQKEVEGDAVRRKVIGTSSPRRRELIKRLIPDAEVKLLRGNVDTRLEKLRRREYDGIIMAQAGLNRLGANLNGLVIQEYPADLFPPAYCQGIISCEVKKKSSAEELLRKLTDEKVQRQFLLERKLMSYMGASCFDAAAVNSEYLDDETIALTYFYGRSAIRKDTISVPEAEQVIKGLDDIWKEKMKVLSISQERDQEK